jgi:hypothetical protein
MTENCLLDHATAQAVSRRLLTTEARVRAQGNPCGICGEQSGTATGFSKSPFVFLVNIIPPWLSVLMYDLGDEQ